MKLKNMLACAFGAGLLMVASGSAQAMPVENELVIPLKAQLTITWTTGNGKIQKARITSKDLVNAIGEDFAENFSGDEIVNVGADVNFELVDKHGNFIMNLTADGVIVADHIDFSTSHTTGSDGKFKEVVTGIVDIEFYSDGDHVTLDNNVLEFIDDSSPFAFTETGSAIKNNGKQKITITEKDDIGADGHDFDVVDIDDLPIFGTITGNGSGTIIVGP